MRERAVFAFENASPEKRDCFGTGHVGDPTLYRAIMCRFMAPFFPSPEMPILDVSVVELSQADPRWRNSSRSTRPATS